MVTILIFLMKNRATRCGAHETVVAFYKAFSFLFVCTRNAIFKHSVYGRFFCMSQDHKVHSLWLIFREGFYLVVIFWSKDEFILFQAPAQFWIWYLSSYIIYRHIVSVADTFFWKKHLLSASEKYMREWEEALDSSQLIHRWSPRKVYVILIFDLGQSLNKCFYTEY